MRLGVIAAGAAAGAIGAGAGEITAPTTSAAAGPCTLSTPATISVTTS